jgi:hypothetical protein
MPTIPSLSTAKTQRPPTHATEAPPTYPFHTRYNCQRTPHRPPQRPHVQQAKQPTHPKARGKVRIPLSQKTPAPKREKNLKPTQNQPSRPIPHRSQGHKRRTPPRQAGQHQRSNPTPKTYPHIARTNTRPQPTTGPTTRRLTSPSNPHPSTTPNPSSSPPQPNTKTPPNHQCPRAW